MNDPVTDAELARVAELTDIRKNPCKSAEERQEARVALAVLCPRIARELAAARAAIKVARETLDAAPIHRLDESRTVFIERYKKWYREQRNVALTQLNQP